MGYQCLLSFHKGWSGVTFSDGFHDSFAWIGSPRRIVQIVCLFSCVSGSGESWFSAELVRLLPLSHSNESRMQFSVESVRLSSSLVLILKRITIVQWCKGHQSTQHNQVPFSWGALHVQNRDVGDSQVSATQRLVVGGAVSQVRRMNDTNKRESGRFVHVKESFIWTDSFATTHHY